MGDRLRLVVLGLILVACGGNHATGGDAGLDAPGFACGNGLLDPNEDCDDADANGGPGARCDTQCHWVCLDDTWCTDGEPCNGAETCVDHACLPGTPVADGADCGSGKICKNTACTAGVCGDTYVTTPEECDDANTTPGDGCETDCTFSCVSTDSTRDCTPADACAGQGSCNDSTHTCTPGTPLTNNTPCGVGGYCYMGACTQPVCGNATIEPGEVCDDGALNGTASDGCKSDCTYACVTPATDCAPPAYCQMATCTSGHVCQDTADPAKENLTCGSGLVCHSGACVTPSAVCGNGVTETGEQCDFGAGNNGPGTGCESNCLFSCTILPNSCDDGNPCNGAETCGMVTVSGKAGQKCSNGSPQSDGTVCGTGKICLSQLCQTSACGDGYLDMTRGETCEPPNTSTCDSACHTIVCGDGVRAGTEQCDDGNATNLDGCAHDCKFEQDHRVNSLSMSFTVDTYCTKNGLGGAIVGGVAQNQVANALNTGVTDGSITVMFQSVGLDDLSGTNDPALSLGALTGAHQTGAVAYNGNSDLDWWYTTDAAQIDASRVPKTLVPAVIAAKVLSAGPAEITLNVNLAGVPALLDMFDARLRANVGAANKPLASANNMTPGHLPAEHLDSALTSYATTTGGELCGDVTAASLATVLAPSALVGCGFTNCTQCFTATNTLLDIIVSGCGTIIGTQIKATQPDIARTPGDVYKFTVNGSHVVTSCTKNAVAAPLQTCLDNAAYTSFLKFTTDRVIAK